jgi:hypothetical protein
MVHITPDFNTKKAFIEAFKSGERIVVFQPGFFPLTAPNGTAVIEAPAHYHKWYLRVEYSDFIVTKILRS